MSPESRELLPVYSTLADEHPSAQAQLSALETVKAVLAARGRDGSGNDDVVALLNVLQSHPEVTHAAHEEADGLITAARSGFADAARRKRRRRIMAGAAVFVTVALVVAVVLAVVRPWEKPALPVIADKNAVDLLVKPEEMNGILDAELLPGEAYPTLGGDDDTSQCARLASVGDEADYRGTGYVTGAFQRAEAPHGDYGWVSAQVLQAVLVYPSARAADAVFTATADAWNTCSGQVFEIEPEGRRLERWTFGQVRQDGPRVSVPVALEGGRGLTAVHMFVVASNLGYDIMVFGENAEQDCTEVADRFVSNVFG